MRAPGPWNPRAVPAAPVPGFNALPERQQAFVRALVDNGNRTAAALAAGYGAVSAA